VTTPHWTQAVEILTHNPPDLILLDLHMPAIQGETILGFIRELDRPVPVIVISAFLDEDKIETLRQMGVREFVSKPFRLNELGEKILKAMTQASPPPGPHAGPQLPPPPPPPDSGTRSVAVTASARRSPSRPHHRPRRKPRNLKAYVAITLLCMAGALFVVLLQKLPTYFSGTVEKAVSKSVESEMKRQRNDLEGLSPKDKEALRKALGK